MVYPLTLIYYALMLASLCIGILLVSKPDFAIELQRRFYARINWKIEPICLPKELRNTRSMGWFMVCFACAALIYKIIIQK